MVEIPGVIRKSALSEKRKTNRVIIRLYKVENLAAKMAIDNPGFYIYDGCIGRLPPFQILEVNNEITKMVWSLAISELTPCIAAGHTELRIDS